jgi:polyisoprenoid-binding protein YceI
MALASRTAILLPLLLLLVGCNSQGTSGPAAGEAVSQAPPQAAGGRKPAPGRQTFVIVPEQSTASYVADEEFFAGALNKLGIAAGKSKVVGSTRAIKGQFELDPEHPATAPGDNTFTVQMNTFTTNQPRRDKWIREEGPRLNDYPVATFKATAVNGGAATGQALNFKLAGNMTIREITKPVTFDVTAQLAGDTLTGVATSRLRLSDFGIGPLEFLNTLTVADQFGIEVQFTARSQAK